MTQSVGKRIGWDERTEEWVIAFPYDPSLVEMVREIDGRRWEKGAKMWRAPADSTDDVIGFARRAAGFTVSEKAQGEMKRQGWEPPTPPAEQTLPEPVNGNGSETLAEGEPVPDATYTTVFENAPHLTLRVRTQAKDSKFAPGEQVVSYLCGPDNTRNYRGFAFITGGKLRVWKRHRSSDSLGRWVAGVQVMLQDPKAAATAYGLASGACGLCGRKLTVPESIEAGMGPTCRGRVGW